MRLPDKTSDTVRRCSWTCHLHTSMDMFMVGLATVDKQSFALGTLLFLA
jgi:hypothetical protein